MKKFLIISSFLLVFMAISTIGFSLVSANEKVEESKDTLISQQQKEVYMTPYGYSLDNPNIIVNPYDISPLTALILFETDEYLPVTITVEGKDNNSTYTNTFSESTRHYIPVYGLYPNTTNKIKIKCGKKTKDIEIKTEPLPKELLNINPSFNDTNKLLFNTSDTYPYAIDNNNDIRWYLTKKYQGKIEYLENNHLLLGTDTLNQYNYPNNIVEIDLLGKIYKQYILDTSYYGTYTETNNSLFILTDKLIELDKQTGTILDTISLEEKYNEVFYNKEANTINLKNDTNNIEINLKTKENNNNTTKEKQEINSPNNLLPLYTTNNHYYLTKSIKIDLTKETKQSDKNIFLVGYKKIDDNYKQYNINILKTTDNIQITGNFTSNDEAYLILDKFLDKRVYDLNEYLTIINKHNLNQQMKVLLLLQRRKSKQEQLNKHQELV